MTPELGRALPTPSGWLGNAFFKIEEVIVLFDLWFASLGFLPSMHAPSPGSTVRVFTWINACSDFAYRGRSTAVTWLIERPDCRQ